MAALKILIVEDEFVTAAALQEKLLQFGYAITDVAVNSDEALLAFRKRLPDLVLCDITLKNSALDGIELVEVFNEIAKVPIVFLTAYGDAETVQRAKKLKPAYYLIKPCNTTQLQIAIDFAIANFSHKQEADPKHSLQFQPAPIDQVYDHADSFFIKSGTSYSRLRMIDIVWVEAMGTNVKIITDQTTYTLSANLSSFSKQVQHHSLVRVHRSYILNVQKVQAFHAGAAFVEYQGGQKEIPISSTYRNEFQQLFPKLTSD